MTESPASGQPVAASMGLRAIAFLMDNALIIGLALLLLRWQLPEKYPDAYFEFFTTWEVYEQTVESTLRESGNLAAIPEMALTPQMTEMLAYCVSFLFGAYWIYFGVVHSLLRGSTLGKSTFNMTVVDTKTLLYPGTFRLWTRAAMVTLTLLTHPVLWINYLLPPFNRNKQAGHDLLAQTRVIIRPPLKEPEKNDEELPY